MAAVVTLVDDAMSSLHGLSQTVGAKKGPATRHRPPDIFHAVAASAAAIFTAASFADGINAALRLVGEALRVNRLAVLEFLDSPMLGTRITVAYQWHSAGVPVALDDGLLGSLRFDAPEIVAWQAPLHEGKLVATTIATAKGRVRDILVRLKLQSILLVPIIVDGRYWGQLGLDDRRPGRVWKSAQTDILEILARMIGAAIIHDRHVQELADANTIVEKSPVILYRLANEPGLPMKYVSQNVKQWGLDAREMLASPTSYIDLVHRDDRTRVGEFQAAAVREEAWPDALEFRIRAGDGSYRWVENRDTPIYDSGGRVTGIEGVLIDVTERKLAEEQIAQLAQYDVVTGLPNRRTFVDRLRQELARMARGRDGFAVHFLDLDHFKDVNETLGHRIGDLLLVAVAQRLKENLRASDIVARFGGDEFAVLQAEVTDPTAAALLAQKIIAVLASPFMAEGHDIHVTTSIGVDYCGDATAEPEAVLRNADTALSRAKDQGRNTYRLHTPEMDAAVRDRVALAGDLRLALEREELFLEYQPQVDARDGRLRGFEALARWRHPIRGRVPPGRFIPIAEATGLITEVGQWVFRAACHQIQQWREAHFTPPRIAVNLSSVQFKTQDVEQALEQILEETGAPTQFLELEITESMLMELMEHNDQILQRLRSRGYTIAIDDFGTGYSSLAYVSRFRPDRLKIALPFVRRMVSDNVDRAIVRAIVNLTQDIGIEVIAEGVESREEAVMLLGLGCTIMQGFYYARPLPVEAATRLLSASPTGAPFAPAGAAP